MSNLRKSTDNALDQNNTTEAAIAKVVLKGDLAGLTAIERVQYSFALCRSLGLNPLTKPIDYLQSFDGKLTPYINALGVAQLRQKYGISTKVVETRSDREFVYCTVAATDRSGRSEEAIAVVPLLDKYGKPLTGERKANAIMKAETKGKRRATLALCGIPWIDGDRVDKSSVVDPPLDILPTEEPF